MPIIHVNILAGRTAEQKATLAERITEAVCTTLETRPEAVRVLVTEYAEADWFVAGRAISAPKPIT